MVLIMTLAKTFQHWKQMRRLKLGTSVTTLLVRDGKVYGLFTTHIVELTPLRHDLTGTLYFL